MKYGSLEKMCTILVKIKVLRERQYVLGKHIREEQVYLEDFHSISRMKNYCESWLNLENQIQLLIEVKAQMRDDK